MENQSGAGDGNTTGGLTCLEDVIDAISYGKDPSNFLLNILKKYEK